MTTTPKYAEGHPRGLSGIEVVNAIATMYSLCCKAMVPSTRSLYVPWDKVEVSDVTSTSLLGTDTDGEGGEHTGVPGKLELARSYSSTQR